MIPQEPPPLPFPSHGSLKPLATDVIKLQKSSSTPDVEFRFFEPEQSLAQTEKKNKACEICKSKKIKCDINSFPSCTRSNCRCHHHTLEDSIETPPPPPPPPPRPVNTTVGSDSNNPDSILSNEAMPSTTVFRKPSVLPSGHYTGETSFCWYLPPVNQPPAITEEAHFPTFEVIPTKPVISTQDQLYLIDVYYTHLNPFYPVLNKKDMLEQLDAFNKGKSSFLSPLFFYALFARAAAHVESTEYEALGQQCLNYASRLVHLYNDKPRCSTVLALITMANHIEQQKKYKDLTKAWLWAGDAFRMALDMGMHRSFISDESTPFGQLCVRTFWLAYITDCTISVTYGRPLSTEEKVLDVSLPTRIGTDDELTALWADNLYSMVSLSKAAARIIKFNYCPPPPFMITGSVKRHNAFLVSVDSWLMDIISPYKEPDSPMSNAANTVVQEETITKRMTFQKEFFLYTDLILLHRPYVNDVLMVKNASNRPSFDICSFAAIMITDMASKLEITDLIYHSKSPMMAYALVMASRIHIYNATQPNPGKYNASKNFYICLSTLERLPQSKDKSSMLHDAFIDLELQYNNRFALLQETEEELRMQRLQMESNITKPVITAAQIVFAQNETERSKRQSTSEKPCDSAATVKLETSRSNSKIRLPTFKFFEHLPHKQKKKSKGSHANSFIYAKQKALKHNQKQKQRQTQGKNQNVFSSSPQMLAPSTSSPQPLEEQLQQQQKPQQLPQQLPHQSSSISFNNNNADQFFTEELQAQAIFGNQQQQQLFYNALLENTVNCPQLSQQFDYSTLPLQTYNFSPSAPPSEPHQFYDLDLDPMSNWDFAPPPLQTQQDNDLHGTYSIAPQANALGILVTATHQNNTSPMINNPSFHSNPLTIPGDAIYHHPA